MYYYTSTIPLPLAEKLKEKGMSIKVREEVFKGNGEHYVKSYWTTYAEVFDWLMGKGRLISIYRDYELTSSPDEVNIVYIWLIDNREYESAYTWHEAAEAAIEKALTLI